MVDFVLIFLHNVHVRPALERVLLLKIRLGKDQYTGCLFYRTRSTAALSLRRPASAETSRDGFGAEDTTDDTLYTVCHRRNGPNFGRVFIMLNYTDITQNTYIQSSTVTEIMDREKCGHLPFPRTARLQLCSELNVREECGTHFCDGTSSAQRDKITFHYCRYVQCLVTLRTTVT